ncbi:hypothetical protein AVEN_94831-1 [Araneus ventricosus]|uniref:Uncharacterized protein n=1 Tax=Araneus ventricosus TaxID=182803 RepID=A0A4Y2CP93_ARAVE|nr:hypothetical protein AVEN_94831-1 [Araneus ventricosus]
MNGWKTGHGSGESRASFILRWSLGMSDWKTGHGSMVFGKSWPSFMLRRSLANYRHATLEKLSLAGCRRDLNSEGTRFDDYFKPSMPAEHAKTGTASTACVTAKIRLNVLCPQFDGEFSSQN